MRFKGQNTVSKAEQTRANFNLQNKTPKKKNSQWSRNATLAIIQNAASDQRLEILTSMKTKGMNTSCPMTN